MAEKKIGHGATLTIAGTTCSQIRNIQPPSFSREDVDATTLDDGVQYNLPSDPEDPGEVTFEQIWQQSDTNHLLLDTDFGARTIATYTIVYPLSTPRTCTFSAWVKSLSPGVLEGKSVIMRTVVLRLVSTLSWS